MTNNEILKQKQAQIFAGACTIAAVTIDPSQALVVNQSFVAKAVSIAELIHLKVYGATPAFQCDHGVPLSATCGFCKRTEEPVEKVMVSDGKQA